ncbi:MAG: LiaF-related protein [Firmicutes bacterium]|nr:LiaF-related protein [Bacillota bacterium]
MKRNFGLIILGLIIVAVGVGYMGNALNWWSGFTAFFPGWWTLFIIVPAVIMIANDGMSTFKAILLAVGVILLFGNIYPIVRRLSIPCTIIVIGLIIIFSSKTFKFRRVIRADSGKSFYIPVYSGVLSNRKIDFKDKEFNGADISTVFGSITLDLTNAKFTDDVIIDASAGFGSIEIIFPDSVRISAKPSAVFGKLLNNATYNDNVVNIMPTVHINASCVFNNITLSQRTTLDAHQN